MSPFTLAKWLPNYLKSFGLIGGLGLFFRVARLTFGASREPQPLHIPGLGRTVWLRPGLMDLTILQQVFVKREYDMAQAPQFRAVEAAYQAALARGQTPLIIDCGAHVGMSVLWFRHLFPAARVVALEPSPENFATLRRNTEGDAMVTLIHGGIWNAPGRLRLTNAEGGMTGFRLAEPGEDAVGDVAVTTIEAILAEHGAAEALVVKIDIEGGEAALFAERTEWLERVGLVVIELHDWLYPWQGTSDGFFRAIAGRPFDHLFRGENLFCFRRPGTGAA